MAYTSNTPQATDYVSATQPVINANFQDIPTYLAVNHEPITGAGGDEGKHKFIQYTLQGSDPATGLTELATYVKNDSSGNPNIFTREPNNGSIRQVSGSVIANFSLTPSVKISGQTMLYGGII